MPDGDEREDVERATSERPQEGVRRDGAGQAVPDPYPGGGDEPDPEVLERHRRSAAEIEQSPDVAPHTSRDASPGASPDSGSDAEPPDVTPDQVERLDPDAPGRSLFDEDVHDHRDAVEPNEPA